MVKLNNLRDNYGAKSSSIRVGRGIGSGKGKTCGRGVKGQKSRSGVSIKGFEGGQMPIFRRVPKRGFCNIHRVPYSIVNLSDIVRLVEESLIDSSEVISLEVLVKNGLVRPNTQKVKVLNGTKLSQPLSLNVHSVSSSVTQAVKSAGGEISMAA